MKIHIGCGRIYLRPSISDDGAKGWLNVDVGGPHMHLAKGRPDLAEKLSAVDEDYYRRFRDVTQGTLWSVLGGDGICDAHGSFDQIPAPEGSASEVLCRQVFEHMSIQQARKALSEVDRVLEPGGVFRIDVPDHDATVEQLQKEPTNPFWIRHMFGSRRDDYGYHVMSYTRDGLKRLCDEHGFVFDGEEPNIHCYPAMCLRFRKGIVNIPHWDYSLRLMKVEIPKDWLCLDVGSGSNPWPRADHVCDVYDEYAKHCGKGQKFTRADVMKPLPYSYKQFDFASTFHVLEHVNDPGIAARNIIHVARRGIVTCPSIMKESLFLFAERDHEWHCIPTKGRSDILRFVRVNRDWLSTIRDNDAAAAMCRMLASGISSPVRDITLIRRWFLRMEPYLDVTFVWDGNFHVEVFQ